MLVRFGIRLTLPILLFLTWGCGSKSAGESDEKAEAAPVAVELTPVQAKSIESTVPAQGVITASQGSSVKVGAVVAGRIANVFVKEGDPVQAGQLVAVLENKLQASQSASAAAALSVAQAQAREAVLTAKAAELDQTATAKIAKLALETAKAERQSAVKQATADYQTAQLELKKSVAGNRPQEVAQAEQTERQAQVAKDTAEREERRNAFLLEKGIVSQKTYDDSKSALANAAASLKGAQSQLSLMREGSREEDKQAVRLKAETAGQVLTSVIQIQDQKVLQAEAALSQANQGVLQVQAKMQEAQASQKMVLQKTADSNAANATQAQLEVRSPITGKVVRRFLNPGDTPDNTSPILEISSLTKGLDLVASLPAASGANLKVGLSADLSVTSQSNAPISGVLSSVGQVDPQTGLLSVRIRVVSPPAWLRPGTFATANIVMWEHAKALVVPKAALLTRDGAAVVFIANGEKAVLKKVEVGAEQDGQVEIVKGLEAGQQVVTLGNYELSDGAAIKTAEPDDKKKDGDKPADDTKKKDDDKPAVAESK